MSRPDKKEFNLVVEAIRYEYKNNPSIPKPLSLLDEAQLTVSNRDPIGIRILIDSTKHKKLKNIPNKRIRSIVNWLQLVEKVLKDKSPYRPIFSGKPMTFPSIVYEDPNSFSLLIFDTFDNWYAAYQVKKNMKLEDMSFKALEHIYKWVSKIYEKFELNPNPEIILIEKDFKGDGLDFLYDRGVVKSQSLGYQGLDNECEVKITIDVEKFIKFKPELEKACSSKLKKSVSKENSKSVIELAHNTKWKNITIQFKDGHNVDIKIKDKTIRSSYKEMGFEDRRTRKPNKQWELLQKLAEKRGEISWQSRPESKNSNAKLTEQTFGFERDEEGDEKQNRGFGYKRAPDSIKKTKQMLARKLKDHFGIKEDPFFSYRKEGSYKIKIILIPA